MTDTASPFISKDHSAIGSGVVSESAVLLFNLSVFAFIAAMALAGGLTLYKKSAEANLAEWVKQVEADEAELKPELLEQLNDLSDSLETTRKLFSGHGFVSNALVLVQSVAHPSVKFSSFNFSRDAKRMDIAGAAKSYQTVAEQVSFMEANPQVEKVEFGGLSRDEKGLVNFKLAVIFKPSLLQLK